MRIFISTSSFGRIDPRPLELLACEGFEVQLNPYGRTLKAEETFALPDGIDGLIAGTERLDEAVMKRLPNLKVISRVGTGLDNVDRNAARLRGIQVFNTPDSHVDAVAELALAGILDVLRRLSFSDRRVREGRWEKHIGGLLRGRTVGIIGLGRVGKALVGLLHPFAVRILAFDVYQDVHYAAGNGLSYVALPELLRDSDIVTLHTPYNPELHHLLDRAHIEQMKRGAVLVNCARGGIVDEAALFDALRAGHLGGAFVDTFEREPYEGPLLSLDNTVLTPHIGSSAAECRVRMEMEAVENLLKGLRNGGTS